MITKEILIDFTRGKKYAFDAVYAAYAPGMFGICLRYTRCEDDAKDVLQETFIKVYSSRGKYDPEQPFGAWIKTIAINSALTYIKKSYRFQLHEDDAVFDQLTTESLPEEDPEKLRRKLLQILQQLPDGYRTVFNLFTIDNLTHKEISEYLGITESTSKTQYFKAKKMIRQILETENVEHERD